MAPATVEPLERAGPDLPIAQSFGEHGAVDDRSAQRGLGPDGRQRFDHLLGAGQLGEALVDDGHGGWLHWGPRYREVPTPRAIVDGVKVGPAGVRR